RLASGVRELFLAVMLLFCAASVTGMSLWRCCPARGSCRRYFCFCGMVRICFRSCVLLVRRRGDCRGSVSVRFGGALRRLLFFFLLFGLFLDSAQLSQDFLALLRSFAAPGELHGKNLLDNLVELLAASHPEGFQLICRLVQSIANRPPLMQVRAYLGK